MKNIEKIIQEIRAQNGKRWIEEFFQRAKIMERNLDSILRRIDSETADYTEEDEEDDED